MKFVRVNMTDKTVTFAEAPEEYKGKAGRWLTSLVISDEVPADCHPLGPNNKIVIAPEMVTGTSVPSSGRLSVGGKSPLTGGIKEANAGTPFAQKISRMGIQAVTAFLDATGYCLFTSFTILDIPEAYEGFVESANGVLGTSYNVDDVVPVGMEILSIERDFNARAGFTTMDGRMPEFMLYEKLPPHNHVFDVTDEDLDRVWEV